jgi:hypothetical protein
VRVKLCPAGGRLGVGVEVIVGVGDRSRVGLAVGLRLGEGVCAVGEIGVELGVGPGRTSTKPCMNGWMAQRYP